MTLSWLLQVICVSILIRRLSSQASRNEVCYNRVGCFSQDSPWVTLLRPFPPPRSPEEMNVTVYLVTNNNRNLPMQAINPVYPDSTLLRLSDFNPSRPATVFIIHGFLASIESEWMMDMANAYLSREDANVFLVDWGNGAKSVNYLQVAANIRVVGAAVSVLLVDLMYYEGLNPNRVHIIGHSLGAHAAGYIGKYIVKINRITALDAAQIGFEGSDPLVRLYETDATFVDAIHTNGKPTLPTLGLGFIEPIGHVDFYVNGGFHQPGCATVILPTEFTDPLSIAYMPVEVITDLISCSHSMSIEYFTEALRRTDCVMWGRKPGIITRFLNVLTFGRLQPTIENARAECTIDTCSPVGLDTFMFPGRGKFSLTTNLLPEYCMPENRTTDNMIRMWNQRYSS